MPQVEQNELLGSLKCSREHRVPLTKTRPWSIGSATMALVSRLATASGWRVGSTSSCSGKETNSRRESASFGSGPAALAMGTTLVASSMAGSAGGAAFAALAARGALGWAGTRLAGARLAGAGLASAAAAGAFFSGLWAVSGLLGVLDRAPADRP